MAFDVFGPIEQSRRCLDLWLKEEKRQMSELQRQRTAALMARYFLHEDQVTDRLLLSFLRHYSGRREIDTDDPVCVREEIKSLLDQSRPDGGIAPSAWRKTTAGFLLGIFIAASSTLAWHYAHKKITQEQQAELKALVDDIALRNAATHASVWTRVKAPLGVRSYRDISWWDYDESREKVQRIKASSSR